MHDMKYSFNLDTTFDEIEDFEEKSDNICTVKVYDDNFKLIENCRVELFLSKNGMIGLGKELIRMAQNFHVGRHVHLDPPDIVEKLGVFLPHPVFQQ